MKDWFFQCQIFPRTPYIGSFRIAHDYDSSQSLYVTYVFRSHFEEMRFCLAYMHRAQIRTAVSRRRIIKVIVGSIAECNGPWYLFMLIVYCEACEVYASLRTESYLHVVVMYILRVRVHKNPGDVVSSLQIHLPSSSVSQMFATGSCLPTLG